jgi:hypothetical protein
MADAARKLLPCPRCKNQVEDLLKIDAGMKLALEQNKKAESALVQACPKCYSELSSLVSQGAKLRAQKTSREYSKKLLWKNRVDFLKQARNLMSIRAYPESAVMYEKYMKSVAIGFDCKPTEIRPELFKDPRHRKELTVMSYVLWDLYKIYDTSPQYADRQKLIAQKLITFAKSNSNIQNDIARKIKNYTRSATNKPLAQEVLKGVDKNLVRCFIATAAFESPRALEVQILCAFRDQILQRHFLGNLFIESYYIVSPPIARALDHLPRTKFLVRAILRVIATRLNAWLNLMGS